jgi:YidC/Oxa1 family membrane protein insertase
MPNNRVLIWMALAAILYLNYEAWMADYQRPAAATVNGTAGLPAPGAINGTQGSGGNLGDSVPQAAPTVNAPVPAATVGQQSPAASTEMPGATAASPAGQATPSGASPTAASTATPPVGSGTAATSAGSQAIQTTNQPAGTPAQESPSAPLHVTTDVLDVDINLKGGELDRADLRQYPLRKDAPGVPVRLLNRDGDASLYLLQSGLIGADGAAAAPTHLAVWSAADKTFELAAGAQELRVPMTWTDGQGLAVTKTYVFTRGSYTVDLIYDVRNDSATPRKLAEYSQLLRHWEHASRSYFDVETYAFKGPAIYDGAKYQKLNVENAEESKFSATITNGWLASMQHHFVAAIVPPADQATKYQLQVQNQQYLLSATGPAVEVSAGAKAQFREKLFIGPKLQAQLETAGPRLELTADYGKLTVLAKPLFGLLKWIHGLIGNWGWSIIIVTALIKLLFYPLSQASGRSMAKMRAVAPRMKQIQESFKDDREKLGRAMMELYKKEKINPLAGCLPMLVQIPFFISFYWVLLESVEMRQAPFMLWVNDLSARDPFFVLPFFMGAAMFAQFKLNPPAGDPMQAKIMQFMPLVMTVMMAWFPSGLVLYWLTNTVLSIAQQWRVNKVVEAEAAKKRS